MGDLVVLRDWKLAREVRREHELVVLAAGMDGRVPPAPTLEEFEEHFEFEEPLGDPRPEGRSPGWGWRWVT